MACLVNKQSSTGVQLKQNTMGFSFVWLKKDARKEFYCCHNDVADRFVYARGSIFVLLYIS